MQILIFFVLLALFVQSYLCIDFIPTPSSVNDKLKPLSCNDNDDCKIVESYFEFQKFYSKSPDILREIPNIEYFKDYLSKEGNFTIINNAVRKYVLNIATCTNFRKKIISDSLLVVTDMQNSFMSNGAVSVNGAENAVIPINEIKKYHEYVIHSLDTHLPLWSLSFSTNPDYINTFYPHARPGNIDFNEVDTLDNCADLYIGKKDFSITSNPLFKEFVLNNNIKKITFTGVAGDYCVNAGILGVLDDPDLSHINVGLYEPGVKWVFPNSIDYQRSHLETYSKFKWLNNEDQLTNFLRK